jgi:alpha-beta hydrolase superfamily lysophospholipase
LAVSRVSYPLVGRDDVGRDDVAERPIVFGPAERRLFGFYHSSGPEGPTRALGVVLCNPVGFEAMCTHRTYRHLAERVAARGFPCLRFDYDGTGDSSGRQDDPDRVRAWVESIGLAIAEMRARGSVRVALFGARLGATFATLAALKDGDIDALVTWAPVVSGRAYVRELRAFGMMTLPGPQRADGSQEIVGYSYSKETLADISAIDLVSLTPRAAKRIFVVPSNDAPKDEARLAEHWKAQGTELAVGPVTRYARMLGDPYDTVVPDPTLDEIAGWLGSHYPDGRPKLVPEVSNGAGLSGRTETGSFSESPLRFGQGGRLFGILTNPAGSTAQNRPAVFFLNVGANHHVGPHRLWVDLGRELAGLGYAAFRFDAPGLGDSLVAPGEQENRIYSRDFVDDVKSAMNTLEDLHGISRFVLVGLCSGAYLSFQTAIEDRRVAGQVLFNTHTFAWKEGDPVKPTLSRGYYARSLAEGRVWKRVLRREVHFRFIARVFLRGLQREAAIRLQPFRSRLQGTPGPPSVRKQFEAICNRGVESLLVFSTIDGGLDMLASHFGKGAHKMRRYPTFAIEIVDGVDHVFTRVASQGLLRQILTKYMTSRFP